MRLASARRGISPRTALFLVVDILLLVAGAVNIPRLLHRPMTPMLVAGSDSGVVVEEVTHPADAGNIEAGDVLVAWDGNKIFDPEAVELFADLSTIGSVCHVEYRRNGLQASAHMRLVAAYPSASYAIFTAATAFVCWMLAVFVLVKRPRDSVALAMHWALVSAASVIILTYGRIEAHDIVSEMLRVLFFATYLCTSAGLLLVASEFPLRWLGSFRIKTAVLYGTASVVTAGLSLTHVAVMRAYDPDTFHVFLFFYRFIHIALGTATIGSAVMFFLSYRWAEDVHTRRAILRLLAAVLIGLVPLLVLNLLPQFWQTGGRVPEQYTIILILGIPFTLIVVFLRSTMMTVEVDRHRGLLRGVLSIVVWCVYLLAVFATAAAVRGEKNFTEHLPDIAVIVALALAYFPLRRKFMRSLDDALFPARANLERIVRTVASRLNSELSTESIARQVTDELRSLLRAEECAVYVVVPGIGDLARVADVDNGGGERLETPADAGRTLHPGEVFALPEATRDKQDIPAAIAAWLRAHVWTVAAPLHSSGGELLGVIVLRMKSRADAIHAEELELLRALAAETARALERLHLHERMIIETEERRRLEELNRMKSFFVSGVSHQLRTPLTSIRMFAEMLREGTITDPDRAREYLDIIEGETGRLARLIDNVLDFSRIERGIKEYRRIPVDPAELTRRAAAALHYQFLSEKAAFEVDIAPGTPPIEADADALQEAVMNLLDNALKYSRTPKQVWLRLVPDGADVVFEVRDRGVGIAADKLPLIFDPFFRARDPNAARAGGAGLGLALVADIARAHGGRVDVSSVEGEGSTFRIFIPAARASAATQPREQTENDGTHITHTAHA
ncbi:MAG: GAF domain-containing protein [Ignavibacteriae bacterium]|nr:GAF domain-containing protein [Ignavibacteriota bacterium]